jgi:hypothetical protein
MKVKLGKIIYWIGSITAAAILIFAFLSWQKAGPNGDMLWPFLSISLAITVWGVCRAARAILSGD